MSKRRILFLVGVVVLFVAGEVLLPKPLNWTPSYSHKDKNPHGAYVLGQLLPGFLSDEAVLIEPITLYETEDYSQRLNLLVLTDHFALHDEDLGVLLRRVGEGDRAFIAANLWNSDFEDTLGIVTKHIFHLPGSQGGDEADSLEIRFVDTKLPQQLFRFPAGMITASFEELPEQSQVLAKTAYGKIVLAWVPWGEGGFYLSSTPLLFTNYFLMQPATRPYAEAALSYLPEQQVLWTEYYHLGRMESPTPLRFILREPALRWSYYLGMGILFSFVLFSLKRRQRPIPVLEPPANTSLQFAETVARLYYSQGNHKDIANKKILYFQDWLRERYQMHIPGLAAPTAAGKPIGERQQASQTGQGKIDEAFLERLIRKSGKPEGEVRSLFQFIEKVQRQQALSDQDLLLLQHKLESFTRA